MQTIERYIVGLDSDPWSALYRCAIGVVLPYVLRVLAYVLAGGSDAVWLTFALFLGVLAALRVGPAVLRRLLPFSAEAKQIWAGRRALAKEYDSYAWQKLFWIGVGLAIHAGIIGGLQNGELAVMVFCLVGGGAGLLVWRGARAAVGAVR